MILDYISDCLGVGRRTRPTTPNRIVDLCEFVGDSIRNVRASRGAGVGAENHAVFKGDGHSRIIFCQASPNRIGGQEACMDVPRLKE